MPPLSNSSISLDELLSIACELERSALQQKLQQLRFIGSKRLLLTFASSALLIDLHPDIATCVLLPLPLTATLESLLKGKTTDEPTEPFQQHWQTQWEKSTLQGAFVSSEGLLHLKFLSSQKQAQELVVRLKATKPNLYALKQDKIDSLYLSSWQLPTLSSRVEKKVPYDYSRALEAWKQRLSLFEKKQQEKNILAHYKPLINSLKRRLEKISTKLRELAQEPDLIHQGQLLQAARHLYTPGTSSIQVHDWLLGENRTLELTQEPIQKQIENYFHRAKGLQAHQKQLQEQLAILSPKLLAYQKALEEDLEKGSLSTSVPSKKASTEQALKAPSKPYRAFVYQGAAIYVGKKAADNLTVSFQVAHGNDLWLHVADYAGSHVVVKVSPITPSILKAAALLAHHYSAARKCSSVEVAYTQAKWVKKIPGSKTGTVGVSGSKRYLSHYDERLLKELLESQDRSI